MRTAKLPSSATRFSATFTASSRITVVGFTAASNNSQATAGTFLKQRCRRASESTRQIRAFESSRFLIAYTLATASLLVASQPIPHTVSVGYNMTPPFLMHSTALRISSSFVIFLVIFLSIYTVMN